MEKRPRALALHVSSNHPSGAPPQIAVWSIVGLGCRTVVSFDHLSACDNTQVQVDATRTIRESIFRKLVEVVGDLEERFTAIFPQLSNWPIHM